MDESAFEPANELEKICKLLSDALNTNEPEKERQLRGMINLVCCGNAGENYLNFYAVQNVPEEFILCLVRTRTIRHYLEGNLEECGKLIEQFLQLTCLTSTVSSCLRILFDCWSTSSDQLSYYERLFQHKDVKSVSMDLIEEAVGRYPQFFQRQTVSWCSSDNFVEDKSKQWCVWSSRSRILFQFVTSNLNELLCRSKAKSRVLKIITIMIDRIRVLCGLEVTIYISLYPSAVRPIVFILSQDPESMKSSCPILFNTYLSSINSQLKTLKPFQVLALLTHFPKWNKFLSVL